MNKMELKLISFCFLFVIFTITNIRSETNTGNIDLSEFHIVTLIENPDKFIDLAFKIMQDIFAEKSQLDAKTLDSAFSQIDDSLSEIMKILKHIHIASNKDINIKNFIRRIQIIDALYREFRKAINTTDKKNAKTELDKINIDIYDVTLGYAIMQVTSMKYNFLRKFFERECSSGRPINVYIYNIFILVYASELQGIILELFVITRNMEKKKMNSFKEVQKIKEAHTERTNERKDRINYLFMKVLDKKSYREYWNCFEKKLQRGTFTGFGSIFQKKFIPENELRLLEPNDTQIQLKELCYENCDRHVRSVSSFDGSVILRNCKSFGDKIELCYSKPVSSRRYEYVKKGHHIYGTNNERKQCHRNLTLTRGTSPSNPENVCNICVCTNEDMLRQKRVSLAEVTSNVQANKVIVGLRLKIELDVLHLEIEEAEIKSLGMIDETTKSWKNNNLEKDYLSPHTYSSKYKVISWDSRSFSLDDVQLDQGYVLTGVKFVYDVDGVFKIAARGHKYNYEKGKLEKSHNFYWSPSYSKFASEVEIEDLDVSEDYSNNDIHSEPGDLVKLSTSSMISDAGQSVVPFIDIVPVKPEKRTPLSGFGLFFKRSRGRAGFLTLKLFGYDFMQHIRLKIDTGKINLSKFHIGTLVENPTEFIDQAFRIVQDTFAEKSQIGSRTLKKVFTRLDEDLKAIDDELQLLVNAYFSHFDDTTHVENYMNKNMKKLNGILKDIRFYYQAFNESIFGSNKRDPEGFLDKRNMDGIEPLLDNLHETVKLAKNLKFLFDDTMTSRLVCSVGRPESLIIYNIYMALCAFDFKGIIMDLYAAVLNGMINKTDSFEKVREMKESYSKRSKERKEWMKKLNKKLFREYWNCKLEKEQKDITFRDFGSIFQKIFISEDDLQRLNSSLSSQHYCFQTCAEYNNLTFTDNSILPECYYSGGPVSLCYSKPGSSRKYEYVIRGIRGIDAEILGTRNQKNECYENKVIHVTTPWYKCDVCECTIEETNHRKYVSLEEVTSNVQENKVVVGLRLKMEGDVLSIDIEQAEIMPAGMIDERTKTWQIPTSKMDNSSAHTHSKQKYQEISWNSRNFSLDDVQLDKGDVLTGVKFEYDNGVFKIAARAHEYNYEDGKLEEKFYWRPSNSKKLSQVIVVGRDIPTDYPNNKVHSKPGEYVSISTSSVKTDAGQTVVPFIDIVPVEPEKRTPLSGFGLFLKRNEGNAGYLTLKLISYDFEPHMN